MEDNKVVLIDIVINGHVVSRRAIVKDDLKRNIDGFSDAVISTCKLGDWDLELSSNLQTIVRIKNEKESKYEN